jgi:hypothetical protein
METKVVDSRGRLALGAKFAGKTVIVQENADQIVISPAVVIPEYAAWLWKNEAARQSLETGLEQARQGQFVSQPPSIDPAWSDEEIE